MRNLLLCFMVMFASPSSWGADFQKGLTAAQNGDFAAALREWIPLAEQDYAAAQFNLGVMYGNGQGVSQDYKIARELYTRAAELGNLEAQLNLGIVHANGSGDRVRIIVEDADFSSRKIIVWQPGDVFEQR